MKNGHENGYDSSYEKYPYLSKHKVNFIFENVLNRWYQVG